MDEQPFADDLREFLRLLTKQKAPTEDRHQSRTGTSLPRGMFSCRESDLRGSLRFEILDQQLELSVERRSLFELIGDARSGFFFGLHSTTSSGVVEGALQEHFFYLLCERGVSLRPEPLGFQNRRMNFRSSRVLSHGAFEQIRERCAIGIELRKRKVLNV